MADVHVVDALRRETRRHLLTLLLNIQYQWKKAFYGGSMYIIAVCSLNERLSLEVEDGYKTCYHDYDDGQ
jgi:hypothetical protein